MLDRTIQPRICEPEQLAVPSPECRVMKNGIPLYILNAGDNEVVRIDLLIEGGRWQQSQRLQALFTNRMPFISKSVLQKNFVVLNSSDS